MSNLAKNKALPWVFGGLAVIVIVSMLWMIMEYKQEQDLSHNVKGRWEHVGRTKWLTVSAQDWQVDQWDEVTKGWHKVDHGTWSVRETGTFIFQSNLNSATIPVKLEGDVLWFDVEGSSDKYRDEYRRKK
ncbi:MAG: hypothetical protein KBG84_01155 [Planctomycetes bacterium]|nr:hypothetical protein [Planctomycetota bacterium]CAG0957615.1 hypothetical protein PLCT2_00568 [Planctomycetaceae bacterium]